MRCSLSSDRIYWVVGDPSMLICGWRDRIMVNGNLVFGIDTR